MEEIAPVSINRRQLLAGAAGIAAAGAVLAWVWLRTPQATSHTTHTEERVHAAA